MKEKPSSPPRRHPVNQFSQLINQLFRTPRNTITESLWSHASRYVSLSLADKKRRTFRTCLHQGRARLFFVKGKHTRVSKPSPCFISYSHSALRRVCTSPEKETNRKRYRERRWKKESGSWVNRRSVYSEARANWEFREAEVIIDEVGCIFVALCVLSWNRIWLRDLIVDATRLLGILVLEVILVQLQLFSSIVDNVWLDYELFGGIRNWELIWYFYLSFWLSNVISLSKWKK